MADQPSSDSKRSAWAAPSAGWMDMLKRTWRETGEDNLGIISAGVAYYAFLALVPLIAATVMTYGLVATPQSVVEHMQQLTQVLPQNAARLIGEQLQQVVASAGGKTKFGLLAALALALFGARSGAGTLITALNIAYEEKETRGFIKVNLLALAMTVGAMVVALAALAATTLLGGLADRLGLDSTLARAGLRIASVALLVLIGAASAATLYYFGPARTERRWVWLTPGSVTFAVVWIAATLGFSFYVSRFGNYNATYGSLGAIVVLLTWLYLSAYALLIGAELNSELEREAAGTPAPAPATSGLGEPDRAPPPPPAATPVKAPRKPPGWLATLAVIGLVAVKGGRGEKPSR